MLFVGLKDLNGFHFSLVAYLNFISRFYYFKHQPILHQNIQMNHKNMVVRLNQKELLRSLFNMEK